MKTFRADLKSGKIRRVYLIYGEESYLRRTCRDQLIQAVTGGDRMNCTFFEGKDTDISEVISISQTLPFFAERRLVLVDNSGFFKKDVPELTAYLPDLPESTCLAFVEEAVDKRKQLYKKISSLGYAVECRRQSQAELMRWVGRGLAQAGKKITTRTAEEFLARTGDDMENIRQELAKLISYVGERETVTSEDVRTITVQQLSDRIFDMIGAIAVRDQKKALDLYYDLLQLKEPPMKILVLVARQFHAILQAKELRDSGLSADAVAERGGWKPFIAKRYLKQASYFSREELERCVRMSVEMDEAVKQGNLKDSLAAEMVIVSFSAKKTISSAFS